MTKLPIVSVVVLNYNGAHLLPACLDSLIAQDYPSIQIIVVDNASIDNSKEIVEGYPQVEWVGLPDNQGLGPGYNAGAKAAKGEKIFFVNNDMRFEPDCIKQLMEPFAGKDIMATDPLQMNWTGDYVIHGAQRFRLGWRYFNFGIPFMLPFQNLQALKETEVPWGCAGALMIDKNKFDLLNGFDPTFFTNYEDVDICWRGWLRGWKTVFAPQARLYHKVGETQDENLKRNNPALQNKKVSKVNQRRQLSQSKNAQRFIIKTMSWRVIITSILIDTAKILGNILRGRVDVSLVRAKAILMNLNELPDILRERRFILKQSITTSEKLLKSWNRRSE